jgi:hypothetical protein
VGAVWRGGVQEVREQPGEVKSGVPDAAGFSAGLDGAARRSPWRKNRL